MRTCSNPMLGRLNVKRRKQSAASWRERPDVSLNAAICDDGTPRIRLPGRLFSRTRICAGVAQASMSSASWNLRNATAPLISWRAVSSWQWIARAYLLSEIDELFAVRRKNGAHLIDKRAHEKSRPLGYGFESKK